MQYKRGYYDVLVRTCARYPSNIAVRQYEEEKESVYKCYTYSELYGVCEYIAQNLQQMQCSRSTVGLVTERNLIVPCVIAAAHKCCTTFMFINPSENLEMIAHNMKFQVVIQIVKESISIISLLDVPVRKPDRSITVFGYTINFFSYNPPSSLHCMKYLEHSFIAMTSGSTGEPKHIQIPVQCIQPNIEDLTTLFNIVPDDVIYFSTPLTFDPSMVEILLACMNGASLLIAPEQPEILFPLNRKNSVTVWQTTPSKFCQISNTHIKNRILCSNSTLKILALGGEPMNCVKRIKELKDPSNQTRIFTLYGVTEMSCWACAAELDLLRAVTDREIPLGNCLSETQIVVEPDPNSREQNAGKIILVSKTRKCIIINKGKPGEEVNSLKYVDTGDLGEVRNGTIYYRGRKDDVIKRFGHKINLQFIDSVIMQCPRVKASSCLWLPKPMLLIVYFSSETFNSKELSDFLKCKLDDKHWPDKIIRVDSLPTNYHGKVSKAILAKLYDQLPPGPITPDSLKVTFTKELKEVLQCGMIYDNIKDKSFFSIGGTSFIAVTMCNKLSTTHNQFGKVILPYLLSPKHTIDEIMQIAENEICTDVMRPKKRVKRSISETDTVDAVSSKKFPAKHTTSKIEPIDIIPLWSYDTQKCVDASPSLLLADQTLYVSVGSHSGRIVVFDGLSGMLQGTVTLKSRIEAAICSYMETPSNIPCGVVGTYDGTILCFQLEDCTEKWRLNIGCMIKSKAARCDGSLYVASYDGKIRCIDILTGSIIEVITICDQPISADLVLAKNQYILLGSLSGVCASIHTDTNTIVWRCNVTSPVFASPVLYDNDKYVVFAEVNGEIHCRTVEKGIKIWKYQGAKGNIFSSICARAIDKLKWQMVFGCHDNKLYSICIKNFQPSLQWKTQLNAPIYSTPCTLADKYILAASKVGTMYAIDTVKGSIQTEYQLPDETFSSPAVYGDYIYIGCRNDFVIALRYILNL